MVFLVCRSCRSKYLSKNKLITTGDTVYRCEECGLIQYHPKKQKTIKEYLFGEES